MRRTGRVEEILIEPNTSLLSQPKQLPQKFRADIQTEYININTYSCIYIFIYIYLYTTYIIFIHIYIYVHILRGAVYI